MIFHCLFIMLIAFLVLMAGLVFLNYSRKEGSQRSHQVVGWSSVIFSLLVIIGLLIGGIVKLSCGGCHGRGMHKGMEKCSGFSGATGHGGKMDCGRGSCRMGGMECGPGHGEMMERHHGMKMHEMHIRAEGDSIEKEVVIIRK